MTIDELDKIIATISVLDQHGYTDAAYVVKDLAIAEFNKLQAEMKEVTK